MSVTRIGAKLRADVKGDVVFIHGLGGHPEATWCAKGTESWMSLLAREREDLAIWTVGYQAPPSEWFGDAMSIIDRATQLLELFSCNGIGSKPYCIVAHSLGGLLAKQLLREAQSSDRTRSIADAAIGIVFLATPHSGAVLANKAHNIRILRPTAPVGELVAHSPSLRSLNRWYRNNAEHLGIRTQVFFETKPIRTLGNLSKLLSKPYSAPLRLLVNLIIPVEHMIVDSAFADPGLPGVDPIPVDADHFQICKPLTKESFVYRSVGRFIAQLFNPYNASNATLITSSPIFSLGRLPVPADPELFVGRANYVSYLGDAWRDNEISIVQLVADGGTGKSTIAWHWLENERLTGYEEFIQAFDWSFYSQGQRDYETDSQTFLRAAVEHFKSLAFEMPEPITSRPEELGRAVGQCLLKKGGVLVLDGVEPLQYPPDVLDGALKDPGLVALLRTIRGSPPSTADNRRLVLITTRWRIPQLRGQGILTLMLDRLTEDEGARLLERFRLPSTQCGLRLGSESEPSGLRAELQTISREFSGHPLSLVLLASLLIRYHGGDVSKRSEALEEVADGNDDDVHRHARRVMRSYDRVFVTSNSEMSGACRRTLLLLGLFDKPAPLDLIEVVRNGSPIPRLTDGLDDRRFRAAIEELRSLRMLSASEGLHTDTLDAHPLVREHFRQLLSSEFPNAWREAHLRLFLHLSDMTPILPETPRSMEPLFEAVAHGCFAGRHSSAYRDVYLRRIMRDDQSYATVRLGLVGPIVTVLSHFFEPGDWGRPVGECPRQPDALTPEDQLAVLLEAGTYLTAVKGYATSEVRDAFDAAYRMSKRLGKHREQVKALHGLWRFALVRGDFKVTARHAKELRNLVTESSDLLQQMISARVACTTSYYTGEFAQALEEADRGLAIARSHEEGSEPSILVGELMVMYLSSGAVSLWHLGRTAEAIDRSGCSIRLANELDHPHSRVIAYLFDCWLHQFCGNLQAAQQSAEAMCSIAEARGIGAMSNLGQVMSSWALAKRERSESHVREMREALDGWKKSGAGLIVPYSLGLIAEALEITGRFSQARELLDEAIDLSVEHNEIWWLAELFRFRGELKLRRFGLEAESAEDMANAVRTASALGSRQLLSRARESAQKAGLSPPPC